MTVRYVIEYKCGSEWKKPLTLNNQYPHEAKCYEFGRLYARKYLKKNLAWFRETFPTFEFRVNYTVTRTQTRILKL